MTIYDILLEHRTLDRQVQRHCPEERSAGKMNLLLTSRLLLVHILRLNSSDTR